MTVRWRCHGVVAVLMAGSLAFAACDGDSGGGELPDSASQDASIVDLSGADLLPEELPGADLLPADLSTTDEAPADLAATDQSPTDLPASDLAPADLAATDVSPTDLAATDLSPTDLAAMDLSPADPSPLDPGLPPATLGKVSLADLKAELEHKDFLLVNVHVPYAGQIPGTDTHLTYQDIDALAAYLGADPEAKAVLYCLSNSMSTSAGNALVKRGYRNLRYLDGGMSAWKNAGYPFEAP